MASQSPPRCAVTLQRLHAVTSVALVGGAARFEDYLVEPIIVLSHDILPRNYYYAAANSLACIVAMVDSSEASLPGIKLSVFMGTQPVDKAR